MKKSKNKNSDCCEKSDQKESKGFLAGIGYGLIPHTGCIAFIIASVLGVTVATQLFKPLLLNPYFFYILMLLSFIFATISATIYLKKQGLIVLNKGENGSEISFSTKGIKRKWKYLSTLYGTTIGVNLLLFMVIFPITANLDSKSSITGAFISTGVAENSLQSVNLKVAIPCPGHAPLISGELKKIDGVINVAFSFPNNFEVTYDSTKTSEQKILSLEVFKTYKASVLDSSTEQTDQQTNNTQTTAGGCCGAAGGCGCGR